MQDGQARRRLVGSSSGAELEDRAVLAEMFRKNFRNSYEIMENRVTLVAQPAPSFFSERSRCLEQPRRWQMKVSLNGAKDSAIHSGKPRNVVIKTKIRM